MRRILRAKVRYISLVPKGANQLPVIFKEDDSAGNNVEMSMLTKAGENFEERGELLSVVYAPEIRDSQGDIASAEVIKDMAYDAAKEGLNLDFRHDEKPISKDRAHIAESFIVQKGDERFKGFKTYKGEEVDVTGAWGVVIKIDDPELRKLYREGKWQGVSMGGRAELKSEKADFDPDAFLEALKKATSNRGSSEELDMDKKELTELLAENNKSLVKELGPILKEALSGKPAGEPTEKEGDDKNKFVAPVFKGQPTSENIKKHALEVRKAKALHDIDWNDADSVSKFEAEMAEIEKAEAEFNATDDDKADIKKDDSEEVKILKRKLFKAQGQSNQGTGTSGGTSTKKEEPVVSEGLSKEDLELCEKGRKAALAYQGRKE